MHPTLTRILHRTEIGLSIGDQNVSICVVAISPLRRTEVASATVSYQPDCLAAAVNDSLAACSKGRDLTGSKVVIGLPPLRVYFSTRPIAESQLKDSPQALLHKLIQSPTFVIDDMSIDLIRQKQGKQTLAGLVSCREKYLSGILAALETCSVQPIRAEPVPCALVRLASKMHRPPRKPRALIRVFLGQGEGLAVLVTREDRPLCWRPFELTAGEEAPAILGAIGSIRVQGRSCGTDADADVVMIHGRPDLGDLDDLRASPTLSGIGVLRKDGPGLDGADAARGLTTLPKANVETFNLIRSLIGRPRFLDIFPWAEAAVAVILLLSATFFFSSRLDRRRAAERAARAEDGKYAWAAKLSSEKLEAEKKGLEAKIESIRSFVSTRILWTSYTRALAGRLTPELAIVTILGNFELESPGAKSRPKRALSIRLKAPIPRTGTVPREIDAFLKSLRDAPLLKKDFPEVDLADLRWVEGSAKTTSMANFSVVCQPAKVAAPKPQADSKAKSKGH